MLLESEELQKSAEIYPEIFELSLDDTRPSQRTGPTAAYSLRKNASPHVDLDDYTTIRAGVALEASAFAQLGAPEASINEPSRQIPMRDGYASTIQIAKSASKLPPSTPLIVLIHGGGWISQSQEQLVAIARALVRQSGVVAVCISYRLTPEHKWPIPNNDAWDSLNGVAELGVT
ncbi:hypothetical protein LTR56_004181 [Elasticomyces elasticus]|nr:hypothetical protein LTR56_004181 [Elasticomyces elasticus]KAK3655071.1 hypothetical protein LTR22_010380 [Elasticomyces elasticus]KAK4910866.1 hypothetical protein LTR49_020477 [Elasticomyces elasticus]KAK5750285.1 hypothetical protein LTS12_019623 [Elasticomyces elasticus]